MPTYVCSVPLGSLTAHQKTRIAAEIARVHHEATGAPIFFVQVVFDEKDASARFLGGQPAANHVWIRGDIRAGRTKTQREHLMLQIMSAVSNIAGIDEKSTDMVEYGHVLPQPGHEQEWFDKLPVSLQSYLKNLGAKGDSFSL
jgi:phenylpyruvate tautomerase PptA (4-oxalocrotonate tautomerase family)